jgi:hypothetical protein
LRHFACLTVDLLQRFALHLQFHLRVFLLLNAKPFIDSITAANAGRQIATGPEPQILYFTGKKEIFSVNTLIGQISASHSPRPTTFGGPSGVGLKNSIFLTIEFREPVVFDLAIRQMTTVGRFLEVLAGRPQNLVAINLTLESGQQQNPLVLNVYWSLQPRREEREGAEKPHCSDVLLDAVFGRYRVSYLAQLKALKALLA